MIAALRILLVLPVYAALALPVLMVASPAFADWAALAFDIFHGGLK